MTKNSAMSKRIGVTVPDPIYECLAGWAKAEGRQVANLCNFLLERAIREAIKNGEVPEMPEDISSLTATTQAQQ